MRMRSALFLSSALAAAACGTMLGADQDDVDDSPVRVQDGGEAESSVDANETETETAVDAPSDTASDGPIGDGGLDANRWRFVFTSSQLIGGNMNGISGGDDLCNYLAHAAKLSPGNFIAYLGASNGVPPWARLPDDHVWVLPKDGGVVFDASPGTRAQPSIMILRDEQGNDLSVVTTKYVWTGLADGSAPGSRTCNGWMSSDPSESGGFGELQIGTGAWQERNGTTNPCNNALRIYCFEE